MAFDEEVLIDRARAAELGFDVARLEQLISRKVDAPLRWTAQQDSGKPAAGYAAATWIEGNVAIDSYTYHGLNPQACSGTQCSSSELGEWTCSDSLELGITAKLRTLDGAVSLQAPGYVLQGRPDFPFGDRPAGTVIANLRGVTGTLELFPDSRQQIVSAAIYADLYFEEASTEGYLRPHLMLRGPGGDGHVEYMPLSGHWPDPR